MPRGFRMGVYVAQTSSDTTVVQYTVDDNDIHYEEFSNGYDVLTPTTFTPTKSGWTFHGWRMDKVASEVVLTNKIATGGLVRLYAVFKQSVTVTYYNNDTTASTASEYKYYNNDNVLGAGFTLTEATISGWTPRGWTESAVSGGAVIAHQNGVLFRITEPETLYGVYQKVVTVSYNANGGTGDPMPDSTGTAYKHPVAGDTNASITLSEATYESTDPDKEFIEWHLNDPDGTSYDAGDTYSDIVDAIMYAYYDIPVIDILAGTWSLYSSSPGNRGIVSVNNKQLTVAGFSEYGQYGTDYFSSGGYQGDTPITKSKGKTLSYSFTFTRWRSNQGSDSYSLYNADTGQSIALSRSGTYLIPDNSTYYVRAYMNHIGAVGSIGVTYDTNTYAYITCTLCKVQKQ